MKIPILTVLVFLGFEWGTKLFRRSDEYVNETLVYLFKWIMFNIAFTWCRVLFSILTKSTFWTKISKLNSNLSLQRKGQEQNVFLFWKNKIANHILSNSEKQTSPQENTAQQLAFECDTEEFHLGNYKIKKKNTATPDEIYWQKRDQLPTNSFWSSSNVGIFNTVSALSSGCVLSCDSPSMWTSKRVNLSCSLVGLWSEDDGEGLKLSCQGLGRGRAAPIGSPTGKLNFVGESSMALQSGLGELVPRGELAPRGEKGGGGSL